MFGLLESWDAGTWFCVVIIGFFWMAGKAAKGAVSAKNSQGDSVVGSILKTMLKK
ncbi:hypothetical protein BH10PLA2_BH10PLA2_12840 [soil metagenome]